MRDSQAHPASQDRAAAPAGPSQSSVVSGTAGIPCATATTAIEGYAAVFDQPDKGGDIIRKRAFARSLETKSDVPLLQMHRFGKEIGSLSAREDDFGLRVTGHMPTKLFRRMQVGGKVGLSFGFRVRAAAILNDHRELFEVELVEISVVPNPMHPLAVASATSAESAEK